MKPKPTMKQTIAALSTALDNHPLICECGNDKHAADVVCEDCQIAYFVEN
jgi:hypothetical protein